MIKYADEIDITMIDNMTFNCDRFFPIIDKTKFKPIYISSTIKDGEYRYYFSRYARIHEEYQYIALIDNLLMKYKQNDPTLIIKGTGQDQTIGTHGINMKFDLRDGKFPLLTTKKMFFKGIVEELLWFLRGSTNVSELQKKKVNIWNDNSTKEYLKKVKLDHIYKPGDIGPGYGHSFRHYGAKYISCETDYSNKGIDQVMDVLHNIDDEVKKINNCENYKPNRRILIDLWNPQIIDKMVLPPCHILYQFHIHKDKESNIYLSSSLSCRSIDIGLGLPFNIASVSLMTILFAKLTNLKPYETNIFIGDAHIYQKHIKELKKIINRKPYPFPKIDILLPISKTEIFRSLKYENFKLENYKYHDSIKMKLIV